MAKLAAPIPVLRVFDEQKTRQFYVEYLGFEIEFEHQYADGYPLYLGVIRSSCKLHLSEHHGDCSPVAKVRIPVNNITAFCEDLQSRKTNFIPPPGGKQMPWGMMETTVVDPFGNKLVFYQEP